MSVLFPCADVVRLFLQAQNTESFLVSHFGENYYWLVRHGEDGPLALCPLANCTLSKFYVSREQERQTGKEPTRTRLGENNTTDFVIPRTC